MGLEYNKFMLEIKEEMTPFSYITVFCKFSENEKVARDTVTLFTKKSCYHKSPVVTVIRSDESNTALPKHGEKISLKLSGHNISFFGMSAVDQMSLVLRKKKQDEIEETHSLAVGSRENFLAV